MDLSNVKTGTHIAPFKSNGNLLNGEDTETWIMKRRNLIGWTYTYNSSYMFAFKRLIVCSGRPHPRVKFASNNHAKCFIDQKEMLISTANLVFPSIENISIIIRDTVLLNHMRIQFNRHWRSL